MKKSNLSAVGLVALLLAALAAVLALPAVAEDDTQAAKAKQIMMVFTTDDNGELNPCG